MRLLLVIDSLNSGGAQRQLVSLAIGLQQRGHNIEVFIYHPKYNYFKSQLLIAGIPIHTTTKKCRFSPTTIYALRQLISRRKYDLVLSFLDTPNIYAELAIIGLDIPLVVSERNMIPATRIALITRQLHRFAQHITVNSHHNRQILEKFFPWTSGKTSTIYNGIDLTTFKPLGDNDLRSESQIRLLALGTIVQRKNILSLIHALKYYRSQFGTPPIINWAGKRDYTADGENTYSKANMLLEQHKLTSYWNWLGERKDIPSLLNDHDALIHPSYREGLPNAICEALAAGLPVLASNISDHPRLIEQGVTGYLFDWSDPVSIAKTVNSFSQLQIEQRREMSEAARNYAENFLSLSNYIDSYESLFIRLIDNYE